MVETYDISFLKELLDIKGFNKTEFFERVGISKVQGFRLLNGESRIRSYNLYRILECFNVSTYEELKLLVANEVEKYHEKESKTDFDIEDLKKFLCEHKIKIVDFINYLGISKCHFYRLVSGDLVAKDKYKDKIIRLFESEELAERISKCQLAVNHKEKANKSLVVSHKEKANKSLVLKKSKVSGYNIAFMKDFLNIDESKKRDFFNYLGISNTYFCSLLNGKLLIGEKRFNKILEYFNVSTYEELKLLVSNEIEKYYGKEELPDIDVEYLNKFLREHNIVNADFCNYLGISKAHFYRLMSGDGVIKDKYKVKIIRLLESEELVNALHDDVIDRRRRGICDISFLKGVINDFDLNQSDIARYLGVSRQFVSLLLNGKENANEEHVKKLEMLFGVESLDELRDDEKGTQYTKK